MKALILGAGGQVGRALAKRAPSDAVITALNRSSCDVTDFSQVAASLAAIRPDFVFNAAAYTAVDRAESDTDAARLLNGVAAGHIATAATAVGARMIHVSTDFIFNGEVAHPRKPSDIAGPQNVYGLTKLEGELAVIAASPQALIVRTAWVYAAQGSNFLNAMLRVMRAAETVKVVSDQVGTPTYADSLASAMWKLVEGGATGIYHFTDSGVASWFDFAVAIHEEAFAAGLLERAIEIVPISTEDYPTAARRPAFSVLDKAKTWRFLGGAAPHWRVNMRQLLREMSRDGLPD